MAGINRWQAIGITMIAAAVCIAATVTVTLLNRPPLVIDTTVGDATIHLSASRSETLFPKDCITLSWNMEHIQAVYLNGNGRTGNEQDQFCKSKAVFKVDLPDGTTQPYVLHIKAWFASLQNRLLLLAISVLLGLGLVCLGWLPGLHRLRNDLVLWGCYVKQVGFRLKTENADHLALLLVILLAGIAVRLFYLPHEIAIDEVETFNHYAADRLASGLSNYNDPNNHLLNTLLMHISFEWFGPQVWFLRLPVLITGILIIPAAYGVARLYYNPDVALLTAALVTSAWYLIFMSVNARGYSLQTLFFLLSMGLAYDVLRRENMVSWLLFAIVTALSFYAVPTALYGFAGIVTWLFFSFLLDGQDHKVRQIRHLFVFSSLAVWLTVVFYSPALARHGLHTITDNPYVRPLPFDIFLDRLPAFFENLSTESYLPIPGVMAVSVLVTGIIALVFHRKIARHRLPVILPLLVVPVVIALGQRVIPYVRVWTYLLPAFYMLAAAGVAVVLGPLRWKRSITIAALVIVILPGVFALEPRSDLTINDRPYQDITLQLKRELQAGDTILSSNPASETLQYYFRIYAVSNTYFYSGKINPGGRVVIIFENSYRCSQSLEKVLDWSIGMRLVSGSQPTLIAQNEIVKVYAVEPSELTND